MNKYSYDEIIHKIENTRRFGNLTGYEVSKNMLEQLGNPQSGIPFVHVAGTNGKGSTTAFLCKILEKGGKKVGMFTSPHLITFEERIRINGVYISKEDVTRLGKLLLETQFTVSPTMFDYCLAMAVLYFKEQACDLMVIETGIGGRYDSTNALGVPEIAVITKIGFDHMGVLGNTLEEIAAEKAGIIKPGCPVVTCEQEPSVAEVLRREFCKVNSFEAPVDFVRTEYLWEKNTGDVKLYDKPAFYMPAEEDYRFVSDIPMKMVGEYQIENAAVATVAARVLFTRKDIIRAGIADTFWKGRMEIVNTDPFFMIDGAHNSNGVHALTHSLQKRYPGEKFHFIMGVMADKDYEEMIDALLPLAIDFITVTPESNRALQSKDLAECIERKGIPARYADDMEAVIRPLLPAFLVGIDEKKHEKGANDEAVCEQFASDETAQNSKHRNKTIAFGSLYFIGAIEAMLEKNKK